jgi:hypothetical protein
VGRQLTLTKPTGRVGSGLAGNVEEWLEVVFRFLGVGFWLVRDAPKHHAWVILVPGDQLADGLSMHLPGCVAGGVWRERLITLGAEDAAAQSHVQTDGSRLIDDHDALPVGIVQNVHLLRCPDS